jgi:hypothetical protein
MQAQSAEGKSQNRETIDLLKKLPVMISRVAEVLEPVCHHLSGARYEDGAAVQASGVASQH